MSLPYIKFGRKIVMESPLRRIKKHLEDKSFVYAQILEENREQMYLTGE